MKLAESLTSEVLLGWYHKLTGSAVVVNPVVVPEGVLYLIGEFAYPDGWDTMTMQQKVTYAVDHGAIVHVHSLEP